MAATETVLVTGAAGHVGGRTCRALVDSGTIRVRAAFRRAVEPQSWTPRCETVVGDVSSPDTRTEVLQGVTRVVHLATRGYSAANPPTNAQLHDDHSSTIALAEEAARRGVRRFVFVSSLHVYGRSLIGTVDEETAPAPDTRYGEARLAIERGLGDVGAAGGMEIAVVRMSNAFGVPEFDRADAWSLLVHDLCRQACRPGGLRLRSNGRAYRNVIALRDAVDVLRRLAETDAVADGTYILAGPETLTVREIAMLVADEARTLFGAAPTVEADERDMARYEPFHLEPMNLRALGITPTDSRRSEIRGLLRYARAQLQGRIRRPGDE